jgi:uncharacterized protein YdaU (DUF1376 family)
MKASDPAFLFYSKDWVSKTAELLHEEKGIFIDLLCYQHQNKNLPTDTKRLAKIVGLSHDEFIKLWQAVSLKYEAIDTLNGHRLVNRMLERVMNERSEKGVTNRISGTFASVLRKAELSNKEYNYVRKQFKVDDFKQIESERLTECLTEWLQERLKSIANADANEDIVFNIKELEEKFENFRKQYQGKKLGLEKEFENFKKKHKDWKDVIDKLEPALTAEIEWRKNKVGFVPEWKNLQTWLNKRCWEQEFEATPPPKKELVEIPASYIFNEVKIDYGNSIPPYER